MKIEKSNRGFTSLTHEPYTKPDADNRIVTESSAIGDYPDSFDKPGSSFLWFGFVHHLNREQVAEVVGHIQRWLKTGSLREEE